MCKYKKIEWNKQLDNNSLKTNNHPIMKIRVNGNSQVNSLFWEISHLLFGYTV